MADSTYVELDPPGKGHVKKDDIAGPDGFDWISDEWMRSTPASKKEASAS